MKQQKVVLLAAVASLPLCLAGHDVMAHTTIADNIVSEGSTAAGTNLWTGVSVPHGCDGTAVRAMSVVFPVGTAATDVIAVNAADNTPVNLQDHFQTAAGAALGAAGLGGVAMIQDKDVFKTQSIKRDGANLARAFHYDFGYLDVPLTGHIPFRITKPTFKPSSCASEIEIRIPIANWCSKSQTDVTRVDVWNGVLTTKFNDPAVSSPNFWPRINVKRTSPLPAGCGAGVKVNLQPSNEAIDAYMPIPGYWPTP